jgi:hypothetical protein
MGFALASMWSISGHSIGKMLASEDLCQPAALCWQAHYPSKLGGWERDSSLRNRINDKIAIVFGNHKYWCLPRVSMGRSRKLGDTRALVLQLCSDETQRHGGNSIQRQAFLRKAHKRSMLKRLKRRWRLLFLSFVARCLKRS